MCVGAGMLVEVILLGFMVWKEHLSHSAAMIHSARSVVMKKKNVTLKMTKMLRYGI